MTMGTEMGRASCSCGRDRNRTGDSQPAPWRSCSPAPPGRGRTTGLRRCMSRGRIVARAGGCRHLLTVLCERWQVQFVWEILVRVQQQARGALVLEPMLNGAVIQPPPGAVVGIAVGSGHTQLVRELWEQDVRAVPDLGAGEGRKGVRRRTA